ncbi:MAG: anti-sigma regulatory factor [Myxococcota bacterium]|nr:anti-sigma regulatory factor [Myxococcota bacterium]
MSGEGNRVVVRHEADIISARQSARGLAATLGFSESDSILIATAISEVARNMVEYARGGEIALRELQEGGRRGLEIVARDEGPGIADLQLAMQDGYSTGHSLGLGLPGARRLMDEFQIDSRLGAGTTVVMRKWVLG